MAPWREGRAFLGPRTNSSLGGGSPGETGNEVWLGVGTGQNGGGHLHPKTPSQTNFTPVCSLPRGSCSLQGWF